MRSTIRTNPASSIVTISPVRNQSPAKTAAVSSGLRKVPVEDLRSAHDQLTRLSRGHVAAGILGIHDAALRAGERESDGSGDAVGGDRVGHQDGGALRQAVPLDQIAAGGRLEGHDQIV